MEHTMSDALEHIASFMLSKNRLPVLNYSRNVTDHKQRWHIDLHIDRIPEVGSVSKPRETTGLKTGRMTFNEVCATAGEVLRTSVAEFKAEYGDCSDAGYDLYRIIPANVAKSKGNAKAKARAKRKANRR